MTMDKEKVHDVQEKLQEKAHIALEQAQHASEAVAKSFSEWDRMRNPYAGWARVGIGLITPFILWSNSIILTLLLVAAVLTHPYWFPPYKGPANDIMTKLIDAWRSWQTKAKRDEKLMLYIPGTALALPFIVFTWNHQLFWTLFFLGFIVAFKVTAARWLLENYKPVTAAKTAPQATATTANKKAKSKKATAKKKAGTAKATAAKKKTA